MYIENYLIMQQKLEKKHVWLKLNWPTALSTKYKVEQVIGLILLENCMLKEIQMLLMKTYQPTWLRKVKTYTVEPG